MVCRSNAISTDVSPASSSETVENGSKHNAQSMPSSPRMKSRPFLSRLLHHKKLAMLSPKHKLASVTLDDVAVSKKTSQTPRSGTIRNLRAASTSQVTGCFSQSDTNDDESIKSNESVTMFIFSGLFILDLDLK
jgi:hypothetical protein